jgi:Glutathione S-transferase, N-terminal domain
MKLYVCYGTFKFAPRPGGHPCGNAYHALKDAGYSPDVVKSYGWGILPDAFNETKGRKEVEQLTGNRWVPTLVTDDGTVVQGSHEIVDWAKANPAGSGAQAAAAGGGAGAAGTTAAPAADPNPPAPGA